ncbi:MAG: hypothetical protein OXR73_23795 [Myxococcales bacterium]|nr:hypothetical protein [Myxococcales bacterium]
MTRLSSITMLCLIAMGACSGGDETAGPPPPMPGAAAGQGTQTQSVAMPATAAAPGAMMSGTPSAMQPATNGAAGSAMATGGPMTGMAPSPNAGMAPMDTAGAGPEPMEGGPGAGDPAMADPEMGDPAMADPEMGDPAMADPEMGDPGAGDPGTGGNTPGSVTLTFTTVTYGGRYAPGNYGAIWFEQPDGTFIKTVKRWAGQLHAGDLGAWNEASGGWPSSISSLFGGGGNAEDMMDAMSQATIRNHESHTVTWDFMVGGELLPDGPYVAVVEMTEDRAASPGPVIKLEFAKGAEAQSVEASDQKGFSGVSLNYAP